MTVEQLTYKDCGINYDFMDPVKIACQQACSRTAVHLQRHGYKDVPWSRGESVSLMEGDDHYLAHLEEGLGTKILVADAMRKQRGPSYYSSIAQCTAAMILNDLVGSGAAPLSLAMHLAVGDSQWLDDETRVKDLINGWEQSCHAAGCYWIGGETPTLKDIIDPGTAVLSGSGTGIIKPKDRLIVPRLQDKDAIVFLGSSGLHANGLSMVRKIATRKDSWWRKLLHFFAPGAFPSYELPYGYHTPLGVGHEYLGDSVLRPTIIYAPVIQACLNQGVDIHYTANITGHGWRKLMRLPEPFVYVITDHGEPHQIFRFLQRVGPISDYEAYGTFNMGVGFALYVPSSEVQLVIKIAESFNIRAWKGGYVKKQGNTKQVEILSKHLVFKGSSLAVR